MARKKQPKTGHLELITSLDHWSSSAWGRDTEFEPMLIKHVGWVIGEDVDYVYVAALIEPHGHGCLSGILKSAILKRKRIRE